MNVQYTVYVGLKLMFIVCIVWMFLNPQNEQLSQFYCATYLLNNCFKQ